MKAYGSVLTSLAITLCCLVTLNAEPIVGNSAMTLPQKGIAVEGHLEYTSYTARYYLAQEEWIGFADNESNTVMLFLPQLHYGAFDFLSLRLSIPLCMHKMNYGTEVSSTGIGDIYFDFKHLLFRGQKGLPHVSWRGGARFATGDKDADVPLGDGSIDFMVELLVTEELPLFAAHANMGYWYNGKVDTVDIDDQIFFTAGAEYPFGFQTALIAELNGFVSTVGEEKPYLLEVCPGLSNTTIPKLTFELSVKVPLTARGGLRYDFSPFVGCKYHF